MVATATKKDLKVAAADNVLAKLHSDAEAPFEASEQILAQAVDESREYFTPQEAAILRAAGYQDVDNIYARKIILARVARVREFKRKAGSAAEYRKAQDAAADAAQREANEAAALKETIRVAQDKLDSLVARRKNAEADLAAMDKARVELRENGNLPQHIVANYHHAINCGTNDLRRRVLNLQGERDKIKGVVDADLDSIEGRERVMRYARKISNNHLGLIVNMQGRDKQVIAGPQWESHVLTLRARLNEVESELDELQEQLDNAGRESESIRDYYVAQL